MSKSGAEYPDVIDYLTEKGGVCSLYIVQSMPLDDGLTLKLQEKINNYLAFALDGQLDKEYPDMAGMKLRIQIELQHPPEGVAAEFLEKVAPYVEAEGVGFDVRVGGND
jgi:hypothetical protein